mgnify:FL=1|jgi:hypothetical protein
MGRNLGNFLGRILGRLVAILLLLAVFSGAGSAAFAGPVDWHEVASSDEGRQWWDGGSLRRSREGNVSVLTRFQAPTTEEKPRPSNDLYVMELDCNQALFRDTSINGLPQFGAQWQPTAGDNLITRVVTEVCAVASETLP